LILFSVLILVLFGDMLGELASGGIFASLAAAPPHLATVLRLNK